MEDRVWEKLDEHEIRIRELEKTQAEQKIISMDIQRNQIEIKNLLLENDKRSIERNDKTEAKIDKSQEKLDKVLDTVLDVFTTNIKVKDEIAKEEIKADNEVKINTSKQKWIIIGSIITSITSILIAIFK